MRVAGSIRRLVDGDSGSGAGDSQPEYEWTASASWVNQRTNDIMQASASMSDSQVLTEYNAMIWALDNESNADLANELYHITGGDNEFEVILYRVTPEMREAFWNRLPASRVSAIDDLVKVEHKGVIPAYVARLCSQSSAFVVESFHGKALRLA